MKPSGSQTSTAPSVAPTTTTVTEEIDPLPLEFRQLPLSPDLMPLDKVQPLCQAYVNVLYPVLIKPPPSLCTEVGFWGNLEVYMDMLYLWRCQPENASGNV